MIRWVVAALAGLALLGAVFGVALALTSAGDTANRQTIVLGAEPRYRGFRQLPAYAIPSTILKDTSGQPYDLVARSRGKLLLLYVGYSNCPDVCPAHMANIAAALKQVSPEVAAKTLVVFITADPGRDTPAVLRTWLDNFSADFVGLTGEAGALANVQRSLGLNPASRTDTNEGGNDMDHATTVFAFPPESRKAEVVYVAGTTVEDFAADISMLIADGRALP